MDLDQLFKDEFEESGFEKVNTRSMGLQEFLVFCSTIGVFSGLWNIFKFINDNKKSVVFKMSYLSGSKKIDVTIDNLDEKEFKDLYKKYPPNTDQNIHVKIGGE